MASQHAPHHGSQSATRYLRAPRLSRRDLERFRYGPLACLDGTSHAADAAKVIDQVEEATACAETVRLFVQDALSRMAWSGAGVAPAGAYLAGSAARIWAVLRVETSYTGVHVCSGDDRGPGCGVVFRMRGRPTRCRNCRIGHGAILLNAQNGGGRWDLQADGTPFWTDRFDPACRSTRVVVECVEPTCGALFFASSREATLCPACASHAGRQARYRARG